MRKEPIELGPVLVGGGLKLTINHWMPLALGSVSKRVCVVCVECEVCVWCDVLWCGVVWCGVE